MPTDDAVRAQLARLTGSRHFSSAPRLSRFLSFVVEKKLSGDEAQIKEYSIAVEVYERSPDYDPQVDSTVRAEASRLRSRLRQYYEESGQDDPIEIVLPKGAYVPAFHEREQAGPSASPPRRSSGRIRLWIGLGLLLVFASTMAALRWKSTVREEESGAGANSGRRAELVARCHSLLRKWVFVGGWPSPVPPSVLESVACFQQAAALEPSHAPAWAGLAEANEFAFELDPARPAERLQAALSAARRATQLDPAAPEGWTVLCSIALYRSWDLPLALSSCREAARLSPRHIESVRRLAIAHMVEGDFPAAFSVVDEALLRQPTSADLATARAGVLFQSGQAHRALDEIRTVLGWNLASVPIANRRALWVQGRALESAGRPTEAEKAYRAAAAILPGDNFAQPALARLLALTGRTAEARSILRKLESEAIKGAPLQVAMARVQLALGESDKALDLLDAALPARDAELLLVAGDPDFQSLRAHPRFAALQARLAAVLRPQ